MIEWGFEVGEDGDFGGCGGKVCELGMWGMYVFELVWILSCVRIVVYGCWLWGGVLWDGVGTFGGDGVRARRRGFAGGEFGCFCGGGCVWVCVYLENRECGVWLSVCVVCGCVCEGGWCCRRLFKFWDFRRVKLVREDFMLIMMVWFIVYWVLF